MPGETSTQQSGRPYSSPEGNPIAVAAAIVGDTPAQPQSQFVEPGGDLRSLFQAPRPAVNGDDDQRTEAHRLATARRFGLRSATQASHSSNEAEAQGRRVHALQKWRLKRVVDYVDCHLSSRITLLDLAAVVGLSRMHFASQFRTATGLRPHEYLLRQRIQRAEALMLDPAMTLLEIALAVGFRTQAHFTTAFKRFAGCAPRRWRIIHQAPPPIRREPEVADLIGNAAASDPVDADVERARDLLQSVRECGELRCAGIAAAPGEPNPARIVCAAQP